MRRLPVATAMAVALALLTQPAAATSWDGDGWFFADRDSISRSGDHVYVNEADCHGAGDGDGVDVPTAECKFSQTRINCATGEKRNMSTGQTFILESWTATMRIYCPAKPAAAVQPATPAAKKPVQSTPANATVGSDLKVCESFGSEAKTRIAACTRIIEAKNPGFADVVSAHGNRCLARFNAKQKFDAALADCNRAITLDAKSYNAVRLRGILYSNSGRLDSALTDFSQAIALRPQDQLGYYDRGIVHVKRKSLPSAIADFTTMHTFRKDEAFYRDVLCWARTSINAELETALSDCDRVVQLLPQKAGAYEQRGRVRLRLGQLKDARVDLDKALSLDAKNAYALYTRALVNAREGKTMASYDDRAAAKKINEGIAKSYDDIGLKLITQAESAPFCPAMTALIKAAGDRAASSAKADVAMPGASYCFAIDPGYWCTWETGKAGAAAKQKALATSAAACLTGYTRKDSAGTTGPAAVFAQGRTRITVGTVYDVKTSSIVAAGFAVAIAKPEAATSAPPPAPQPAAADKRLQMLKDGCAKGVFSEKECKEAGIIK